MEIARENTLFWYIRDIIIEVIRRIIDFPSAHILYEISFLYLTFY